MSKLKLVKGRKKCKYCGKKIIGGVFVDDDYFCDLQCLVKLYNKLRR